jgi:hypothetical protein
MQARVHGSHWIHGSIIGGGYTQIHHVHASRPYFTPSRSHILTEFRVILFEIDWARGEAYNNSVDRAADDSKKDASHDQSYSHPQSESEKNEMEDKWRTNY